MGVAIVVISSATTDCHTITHCKNIMAGYLLVLCININNKQTFIETFGNNAPLDIHICFGHTIIMISNILDSWKYSQIKKRRILNVF